MFLLLRTGSLVAFFSRLTPTRNRKAALIPTFTTTMRMVHRIHSHNYHTGLLPSHRLCPALRSFLPPLDGLDTLPIVALHRVSTNLSTPDDSQMGILAEAEGSFRIFVDVPFDRTSFPPSSGRSSRLWMRVPMRIMERGIVDPICEARLCVKRYDDIFDAVVVVFLVEAAVAAV
ncbi:hypothetical protein vseg_019798 [Gypsophila vaccaria]